ncbi:hypothetical protein PVAG01_08653 [Phlyctema vagabunda]|uniref:Uncharacterized protein n=1 Tax=Phlyctema vagabunda TaxID=108571 RepID=A0ABR4PA06_9HELO
MGKDQGNPVLEEIPDSDAEDVEDSDESDDRNFAGIVCAHSTPDIEYQENESLQDTHNIWEVRDLQDAQDAEETNVAEGSLDAHHTTRKLSFAKRKRKIRETTIENPNRILLKQRATDNQPKHVLQNARINENRRRRRAMRTQEQNDRDAARAKGYKSKRSLAQLEKYRMADRSYKHAKANKVWEANHQYQRTPMRASDTIRELLARSRILATLRELAAEWYSVKSLQSCSIIICGRKSWTITEEEYEIMRDGNDIALGKFMNDFIGPVRVAYTESCVWHDHRAFEALPFAMRKPTDNCDDVVRSEDWNEIANGDFCRFVSSRPDREAVVVLIRGVDGVCINPDSWTGLQVRYPKLRIIVAMTMSFLVYSNNTL